MNDFYNEMSEYKKDKESLKSLVDSILSEKKGLYDNIWDTYKFESKTLQEIAKDLKDMPFSREEKAAQIIDYMLTMTYPTYSHPVSIYMLKDADDTSGKRVCEGENLQHLLDTHPELKDCVVMHHNDYFNVKVLRVLPAKGGELDG